MSITLPSLDIRPFAHRQRSFDDVEHDHMSCAGLHVHAIHRSTTVVVVVDCHPRMDPIRHLPTKYGCKFLGVFASSLTAIGLLDSDSSLMQCSLRSHVRTI